MNLNNLSALACSFVIIAATLFMQSCGPDKAGVYRNEQIPSRTASTLHDLNNSLLSALKANDPEALENMMSEEMIANHDRLTTSEHASNHMKDADYSLMLEYLIVNDPIKPDSGTIKERNMGSSNFDYVYSKAERETYIAFFTPKTAPQKWLITATYNKLDYGWKITSLEFNPYAENGRTAPELARYAAGLFQKGDWTDTYIASSCAINCIKPADNWTYVNEGAVQKFSSMALEQAMQKYKFPLFITQVPTKPRIWHVLIEKNKEGSFPNISYISSIKLSDTTSLKKENDAVCKAIGQVMPGIDKNNKYIYYSIYNGSSDGAALNTGHYDIRQKL
jgi:hypothetical protein